ncbi:unnamed protein product [Rhizophagus irregularis]|nr:unnamed protein product [Rhizophagus irregularis]
MNLVLKKKEIINLKSYLVGSQELREQLQLALASCESKEEENGILQIFFHNTLRGHDKKRLRVKEPGSSILLAAADNNTVELSSIIYEMLMSNKYKPDPHSEFTSLLYVKVSSKITTKNLGRPPKHFIEGYQEKQFFITEQMIAIWEILDKFSKHSIKRICLGPLVLYRIVSHCKGICS